VKTERGRAQRRPFVDVAATDIKRRSVRGGAITITSQGLKLVLRMGSIMAMARLVSPEDFGVQGMVVAVTNLLGTFRDVGLGTVTVQREELTHDQVSTLFWVNTAVGALVALLVIALAPGIAWFYNDPRLTLVAAVSALAFVAGGLSVQHIALLQRQMRFVALAVIELAALSGSAIVGIAMAWLDWGYWSLVGMTIALPVITAIGGWIAMPWLPGAPRRGIGLRGMLTSGGTVTCNTLVMNAAVNADKILIGHYWGAIPLGIYGRAYQLISLPSEQILGAISTVAMPALSRLQSSHEELRRGFLRGYSIMLAMMVPITVICLVFAEEVVWILFGSRWGDAAPVVRCLAPTVFAWALLYPNSWLLLATGRYHKSLFMSFLLAPAIVLGVALGLRNGDTGVAIGLSTAMVLMTIPMIFWARVGTAITGRDTWQAIQGPFIAGIVSGLIGYASKSALGTDTALIWKLALGGTAMVSSYLFVLLFLFGQGKVYHGLLKQLMGSSLAGGSTQQGQP